MSGASVVNVTEFAFDCKRFGELTKKQAVQAQRKVTLQILRGCIMGNPRDTGRSQNAWTASVGAPSSVVLPPGEYGEPTLAFASGADLAGLQFGQDSFVVNNSEYVGFLEAHHKTHAGWVAATVANVEAQFGVGL